MGAAWFKMRSERRHGRHSRSYREGEPGNESEAGCRSNRPVTIVLVVCIRFSFANGDCGCGSAAGHGPGTREHFVANDFSDKAYADQALPIACGQTISQPMSLPT
jgi:hypothetical protein